VTTAAPRKAPTSQQAAMMSIRSLADFNRSSGRCGDWAAPPPPPSPSPPGPTSPRAASPSIAWAAGGLLSSAQDVTRFYTVLLAGRMTGTSPATSAMR
jgi:CubicO group peptidase (beta-lactamase class C family)